jgi:hypothetical protein
MGELREVNCPQGWQEGRHVAAASTIVGLGGYRRARAG